MEATQKKKEKTPNTEDIFTHPEKIDEFIQNSHSYPTIHLVICENSTNTQGLRKKARKIKKGPIPGSNPEKIGWIATLENGCDSYFFETRNVSYVQPLKENEFKTILNIFFNN